MCIHLAEFQHDSRAFLFSLWVLLSLATAHLST
jgi:hypothetical protein